MFPLIGEAGEPSEGPLMPDRWRAGGVPQQGRPSGVPISEEALLPNRKRRSNIHINKLGLFINGIHVSAPPRNVALLACLYANLGKVVPYRRLFIMIGDGASPAAQKHLLRQYMLLIKTMLSAHKVPYVLAVAHRVGYGLCELADNPG
jgi:hypothetical protein